MGNVQPPFVPPSPTWDANAATPPGVLAPRFSVNQQVRVLNLDPSLQPYTDFWVNDYYLSGYTWIYELRTSDGVVFVRTEDQVLPYPEPTPPALSGVFGRDRWDWTMPLALATDADTMPSGTLVHLQSEIVEGQQVQYQVRDFIGRVATVDASQLALPALSYANSQVAEGLPLFGTAQGRIHLAGNFGTYTEGTQVQIENAYFDTRTDEWFYYVRLPDGGRMPLRESDLTSTGLTG
jgi:hypothetical protein